MYLGQNRLSLNDLLRFLVQFLTIQIRKNYPFSVKVDRDRIVKFRYTVLSILTENRKCLWIFLLRNVR